MFLLLFNAVVNSVHLLLVHLLLLHLLNLIDISSSLDILDVCQAFSTFTIPLSFMVIAWAYRTKFSCYKFKLKPTLNTDLHTSGPSLALLCPSCRRSLLC